MGRRLRKKDLLISIRQERKLLDKMLSSLTRRQMTVPGVTKGGWSVKDIIAHLAEWQKMNLDWYAAGVRGERPHLPAPGYTMRELPLLNHRIFLKYRRRPLRAVMNDFQTRHNRIVRLIRSLSDADLITPGRYSWTGPSWTLSDYLRAATTAHYLWARTRIRRWHKRQETGGV
ncbi:MAG TPA: ClbS/DfsB family four-helix bundle protein [Bacteroidota bacterium]|nr:ClbS/DfsB family four-helix bundle protein [Bacteroidota bacterium]